VPSQAVQINITLNDWTAVSPLLVIAASILLLLVVDMILPPQHKVWLARLALLGVVGAGFSTVVVAVAGAKPGFGGMVVADAFAAYTNLTLLAGVALTILVSSSYIRRIHVLASGEYYALILASTLGMMLLASGAHFMVQFLGLGLLSLGLYILAGFTTDRAISREAALKYFLLSSFATAFFLYGVAFLYGASGTTSLSGPLTSSFGDRSLFLQVGLGLVAVGLGFKVSAVPFHMWTPDVYQGAPAPVTLFMAVGTKAAAFAAIFRIFNGAFSDSAASWQPILWLMAVLTMIAGNLLALRQSELKRMLAYSSVAHAGYILVGVVTNTPQSVAASLYYLAVYTAMNAGAFAVLAAVERSNGRGTTLAELRGLATRKPVAAAALGLFLFSLTGIPPLAGFFSKLAIFTAAAQTQVALTVIGLAMSAVSAYYYLRVAVALYAPLAPTVLSAAQGDDEDDAGGVTLLEEMTAVAPTFSLNEPVPLARSGTAVLEAPPTLKENALQLRSGMATQVQPASIVSSPEDGGIVQGPLYIALGLAAAGTLLLGFLVGPMLDAALRAAQSLR